MNQLRRLVLITVTLALSLGVVQAKQNKNNTVDCATQTIQAAVDKANGPTTVFVEGVCEEDLLIITDDIILSGNQAGAVCDKENPGGTGTINGTVTFDSARGRIEHLTLTGSGGGVEIFDGSDVDLVCNDISNNQEIGVFVSRSNANLRDYTLSGNGTRTTDPFIFFDSGLFAADGANVKSDGNRYEDNQYAAVEIDRQSTFLNGAFLPREPGHPADPGNRDVFTERGCDAGTGGGCFTTDFGPVAIVAFNGGLLDLRNAEVNGEIEVSVLSSFRVRGDSVVQGNISNMLGSMVRLKDRSVFGDRAVTYTGTLNCADTAQTFYSDVQCGQTCSGMIPSSCAP